MMIWFSYNYKSALFSKYRNNQPMQCDHVSYNYGNGNQYIIAFKFSNISIKTTKVFTQCLVNLFPSPCIIYMYDTIFVIVECHQRQQNYQKDLLGEQPWKSAQIHQRPAIYHLRKRRRRWSLAVTTTECRQSTTAHANLPYTRRD